MIRLAFMTDKARVIGDSTPEGNEARFPLLPKTMVTEMLRLYRAENIAVGQPSATSVVFNGATTGKYIITLDEEYVPPFGLEDAKVIHDYRELVSKYQFGSDELLVVGGLTIFKLFTPFAKILDVAETDELVPGNLIFDTWDNGDFELVSEKQLDGFRTLRYVRKAPF